MMEAILAFRAGGQRLGVPVDAVREAAVVRRLVALPGAPLSWAGVTIVRGEPVGVLDVARAVGSVPGTRGLLVVLHGRDQALLVDRVEGVVRVLKEGPAGRVASLPDGPIHLLDLDELLPRAQA